MKTKYYILLLVSATLALFHSPLSLAQLNTKHSTLNTELTLDSCLALARRNNVEICTSQLEIEQAREVKRQVFTKYFPQLNLTGLGYYSANPLIHFSIEDVQSNDMRELLQDLYDRGMTSRSQARILSGIKAFYFFLVYDGVMKDTENPTELLDAPKIGLHLPDVLSIEEIEAIINQIDMSKPEGNRNRAMVEVM